MLTKKILLFALFLSIGINSDSAFASSPVCSNDGTSSKLPTNNCQAVSTSFGCSNYFQASYNLPTYPDSGCNTSTGQVIHKHASTPVHIRNSYSGGCPTYTLSGNICTGKTSNSTCSGTSSTTTSCSIPGTFDYGWSCTDTNENGICPFPMHDVNRNPQNEKGFPAVLVPKDTTYIFGTSCPTGKKIEEIQILSRDDFEISYSANPNDNTWTSVSTAKKASQSSSSSSDYNPMLTNISPSVHYQTLFLQVTCLNKPKDFAITQITCSSD